MLGQHVKEQIAEVWKQQTDDQDAFLEEVVVCKELGKILKSEQFDFKFNPNEFLMLEDDSYDYEIDITIGDIDELIQFCYE